MSRNLLVAAALFAAGAAAYFIYFRRDTSRPVPGAHEARRLPAPAPAPSDAGAPDADARLVRCDAGDAVACREAAEARALSFDHAPYVDNHDASAADRLFAKACRAGDAQACRGWGKLHQKVMIAGPGPDDTAAAYEAACAHDEPQSCTLLGFLGRDGAGENVDRNHSAVYFLRACDLDDGVGCLQAARYYTETPAIPDGGTVRTQKQLLARALELLDGACSHDDGRACGWLGVAHEEGMGVPKNRARAKELYTKSCALEKRDPCRELDELEKKGK